MTKYLYGQTSFYALGIDGKVLVDLRIYFSTGSNLHNSKIINTMYYCFYINKPAINFLMPKKGIIYNWINM